MDLTGILQQACTHQSASAATMVINTTQILKIASRVIKESHIANHAIPDQYKEQQLQI